MYKMMRLNNVPIRMVRLNNVPIRMVRLNNVPIRMVRLVNMVYSLKERYRVLHQLVSLMQLVSSVVTHEKGEKEKLTSWDNVRNRCCCTYS